METPEPAKVTPNIPGEGVTPEHTPEKQPEQKSKKLPLSKKQLLIGGIILAVLIGVIGFLVFSSKNSNNGKQAFNMEACIAGEQQKGKDPQIAKDVCILAEKGEKPKTNGDLGNANSTDPVEKGKALSAGACTGTGSKKLASGPMRASDLSIIVPYGLLAGPHVTPVDHQYYWGKVQFGDPDRYDVLAPSDGHIVTVQYRDRSQEGGKVKGDYRVVISYSCTFFSYFDLATSLTPEIANQLPKGWEQQQNKSLNVNIPVKQGQVVAKIGGQGLDYAVWDTTKYLKNLTVPEAYNVAEPWKIVTVSPLDYYTDSLKKELLPYYGRTAEPRDGVIDQDIDGKLVGNWFQEGTYGYAGSPQFAGGDYYKGHLALVHNLYDTNTFMFSIGSYSAPADAQQFVIKNPSVTPDKATASNSIIKYELTELSYKDGNGVTWNAEKPTQTVTAVSGITKGTALVQMLENRKIKVEVFPGKTPAQVSGFTGAAKIYTRGEDAKNAPAITNPNAPTSTATQ